MMRCAVAFKSYQRKTVFVSGLMFRIQFTNVARELAKLLVNFVKVFSEKNIDTV